MFRDQIHEEQCMSSKTISVFLFYDMSTRLWGEMEKAS